MTARFTARKNFHLMKPADIPVDPTVLDLPESTVTKLDYIVAHETARTGEKAEIVRRKVHEWLIGIINEKADRWEI